MRSGNWVSQVKALLLQADISLIVNADGLKGYDGLVDIGYDKVFRVNKSANQFTLKGEDEATQTVKGNTTYM